MAIAVALGFVSFTLSVLPVTTAEAECVLRIGKACHKGEVQARSLLETGKVKRLCCTTPSEPSATEDPSMEDEAKAYDKMKANRKPAPTTQNCAMVKGELVCKD